MIKISKGALKEINKLSLKERKELVAKELQKNSINSERLKELILMDNTMRIYFTDLFNL